MLVSQTRRENEVEDKMPSTANSKKLDTDPDGFDLGAVSSPRGGALYLGVFVQKQIPF